MNYCTIKLEYFKSSGKFYSDGSLRVPTTKPVYKIISQVRCMQVAGLLPELAVGCGREFNIYVDCSDHPNGYPALIPAVLTWENES